MEYTWQSSDVRTDYDLKERNWTNILNNMDDWDKRQFNLDSGDHLAFLQNYRFIAESGANDSKLTMQSNLKHINLHSIFDIL